MVPGVPEGPDGDGIRVLHLDDDPNITNLTSSQLAEKSDDIEVVTANAPTAGLERIEAEAFDCIVSDYDMPEMDGLEFLETVREQYPDLPFILFTGKGSEGIASEAISRGVTDYLKKSNSPDQYTVLANRIENAVSQYRAEKEVETRSAWYGRILEHSSDYVMVVDGTGVVKYVSPAIERVMGYTQEEIVGTDSFENIHPEDMNYAADAMAETIEHPDREVTVEFRAIHKDGSTVWLEARGSNFLDDPLISGVMVNVRDITERKRREQELEERREYLQDLTSFLSHDVENQVSIIKGYTNVARQKYDQDGEEFDQIRMATDRIEQMIEKVKELAHSEQEISELEPIRLRTVVGECWDGVTGTDTDAEVVVESDATLEADQAHLRSLLENLLGNAINHGGPDVTVRVGRLEDRDGVYVADDGAGIPEDDREQVFDTDYTTSTEGTGLGLAIVRRVADAHDWDIDIVESADGGARFEITGVAFAE